MTTPKAPECLSSASRRLFGTIVRDYELEPWHLEVLVQALQAKDRADQARAAIGTELMVTSRLGEKKVNPLVAVEREARAQFGTLMKQLGLDVESAASPTVRKSAWTHAQRSRRP